LTAQGKVQYEPKTPYHDGTTHVILEPLEFIARLAPSLPNYSAQVAASQAEALGRLLAWV
jgi:hypothetical protein